MKSKETSTAFAPY